MTLAKQEHPETKPLALAEQTEELETRFALAVRQRELLEQYIRTRMKPEKHFYKITGSDKDSLNKEGAELICLPHGYKPVYQQVAGPNEPPNSDGPYQITVKCSLHKADMSFGGEGLGSASSWITKKDGTRRTRQNDPGLCHNATLKMAQKSAYIAATLNSTAASEFFTQDLEETDATPTQPDQSQHYCAEHKANWFKKGKMHGYAHKIEGTDQWCNEPSEKAKPAVVEGKVIESKVTPPKMDATEFWTRNREAGRTANDVELILGKRVPTWLEANPGKTYADVLALVEAAQAQAPKQPEAMEIVP